MLWCRSSHIDNPSATSRNNLTHVVRHALAQLFAAIMQAVECLHRVDTHTSHTHTHYCMWSHTQHTQTTHTHAYTRIHTHAYAYTHNTRNTLNTCYTYAQHIPPPLPHTHLGMHPRGRPPRVALMLSSHSVQHNGRCIGWVVHFEELVNGPVKPAHEEHSGGKSVGD